MNDLFVLIAEFFKTGLFAIGGGLATLPFLYEMSSKYGWFTSKELTDMLAISESTPGPIGINMSTYAGVNAAGIIGGIAATLALAAPSIIIIIIIARILEKFRDSKPVKDAMEGVKPAAIGLIASAGWQIFIIVFGTDSIFTGSDIISWFSWRELGIFAVMLFFILKFDKHPVVYIMCGAALGLLLGL